MPKQDLECQNAIFGPNSKVKNRISNVKMRYSPQFECQNRISNDKIGYQTSKCDNRPKFESQSLVTIYHPFKYLFGICMCPMLTCLLNLPILAQNDIVSILVYFGGHFL